MKLSATDVFHFVNQDEFVAWMMTELLYWSYAINVNTTIVLQENRTTYK